MLNEREMKVLAGFLKELMPIGASYNYLRWVELVKFLCFQLELDYQTMVELIRG